MGKCTYFLFELYCGAKIQHVLAKAQSLKFILEMLTLYKFFVNIARHSLKKIPRLGYFSPKRTKT